MFELEYLLYFHGSRLLVLLGLDTICFTENSTFRDTVRDL